MSRSLTKKILRSTTFAAVAALGIGIGGATGVAASPEEEIARLNRVRANLFEELVKTRAETAAARAELEAATRAREAAEAELARLKQEMARRAEPAPSTQAGVEPQKRAVSPASRTIPNRTVRAVVPAATGSVRRAVPASTPRAVVRNAEQRAAAVRAGSAPRQATAPAASAQGLPSVLRLEDQR